MVLSRIIRVKEILAVPQFSGKTNRLGDSPAKRMWKREIGHEAVQKYAERRRRRMFIFSKSGH